MFYNISITIMSHTSHPQPKRRRGAQPGNTNAVKHGFYSRRRPADHTESDPPLQYSASTSPYRINGAVPPLDWQDDPVFTASLPGDMAQEIHELRAFIQHAIQVSRQVDDPEQVFSSLRSISIALSCLSRLIRVHRVISQENYNAERRACFDQALKELHQEMTGLENPTWP
jgi:hypothetical protein